LFDIIIIGSGIAALYASIKIPKDKKVLIVSKGKSWECNSFYAQGGIAAAFNESDIDLHIEDTLSAGCNINDKKAVELLCKSGKGVIDDLIQKGFGFDRDENGDLSFTKEAAHSTKRILHASGDATGRDLHLFLMHQNKNFLLYNAIVTDLLIENDICYGVKVFKKGQIRNYYAHNVVIASGGFGALYDYHTNSTNISGDLQGICANYNIKLENMHFAQFHPTVFLGNQKAQKLLLTEALRGEGATVVNENGERFLSSYSKEAELSARDVVSRSIFDYKQKTSQSVYLSLKMFDKEFFEKRFPTLNFKLRDLGFNVPKDPVPISPAFHYAIGGIKTNLNAKVDGFKNLYAIGEVASTGVHGANRLASNSLLEALVFANEAVKNIKKENFKAGQKTFSKNEEDIFKPNDKNIKNQIRKLMWENVGIVRSDKNLQKTLSIFEAFLNEDIGKLLRLRLFSAVSIVKQAIENDSLGTHFKNSK
jgi:L-aspartate oxidase